MISIKSNARKPAGKQVRLRLVYVDFWSVLKLAFLIGLAIAVIQVVVTLLVYSVLAAAGVLEGVATLVSDVAAGAIDVGMLTSLPTVMAFTIVSAALNLIVSSALGAIGAVLYNIAVRITGGVLVGFTND